MRGALVGDYFCLGDLGGSGRVVITTSNPTLCAMRNIVSRVRFANPSSISDTYVWPLPVVLPTSVWLRPARRRASLTSRPNCSRSDLAIPSARAACRGTRTVGTFLGLKVDPVCAMLARNLVVHHRPSMVDGVSALPRPTRHCVRLVIFPTNRDAQCAAGHESSQPGIVADRRRGG